ncbi:ceramide kinase-like [Pollicipes pollicipes]|uniref:ceramide kinase-like n=1 Tax=Pollicipes pollicipes TaxID=41117 RepID=UPI001884F24C|nr:ceramide kinase-like [Pollicipes pollicipes]
MRVEGMEVGVVNTMGTPIRQGYFQINSVRHKVSMGQTYISWEPEGTPDLRHLVPLSEVVAVSRPQPGRAASAGSGAAVYRVPVREDGQLEQAAATCGRSFAVHYAERAGRRWKVRVQHFHQRSADTLRQWVDELHTLLQGFRRPQSLMVFINPACGRRRGPAIYKKKVKPIFALAGVQTEVIQTTHASHASSLLQQCSLSGCDGVVVVGGDGTLMEVLNGLLKRQPDDQSPNAPVPIGVIPAGSTDAVCGSLQGSQDAVTAALHIVMGSTRWVDVCSLRSGGRLLRYSLSMITYGFFGDLLKDSEKLLWLGPMRYNVAGAGRFWRSRAYRGSVAFRTAAGSLAPHKPCFADCDVCCREPPPPGEWHRVSGPFLVVSSANVSCRCKITPAGMCPRAHLSDGWAHLILVRKTSRANFLRYMYRSAAGKDPFDLPFVEYYRVKEFELLPEVVGDGHRLLWETHVNSALSVDSAAAGDWPAADPEVAVVPPAAGDARDSVWNCDGEVVAQPRINLRVHPRAVRMFGRGVERVEERGCCGGCGGRAKKHI